MSCYLRFSGAGLDVDAFLADCGLAPFRLWRRGEARFPGKPQSRLQSNSGATFLVSEADFSELARQCDDALAFLRTHEARLARLVSFAGVEAAIMDFGVATTPPHWASFAFAPDLLAALAAVKVTLGLSVYPQDDDAQAADASLSPIP